jgi:uncharacterized RDD family membrane protein YckC
MSTSRGQPPSGSDEPSWGAPAPPPAAPPPGSPPPGGQWDPQWGPGPGGPGAPGGAGGTGELASWGQRAGAALLDVVFVWVVFIPLFIVAAVLAFVLGMVSEVLGTLMYSLLFFVGSLGLAFWLALMEAGPYGQTPGKHVVGIRVVDPSGRTVSKGTAVGRYFSKILSGLPCYLGYLWPLWDAERRTFHDMIVSTRVVVARDKAPSVKAVVMAPFGGGRG